MGIITGINVVRHSMVIIIGNHYRGFRGDYGDRCQRYPLSTSKVDA